MRTSRRTVTGAAAADPHRDAATERLPSITVITVCLNARPTLPEALQSVRGQVYPRLEHVVVDGASTDGTVELLEQSEDIRYISEPDRGLSHAMNKGVELAQGDIVSWLHADDFYLPEALTRVGEAFAAHPDALWATAPCTIVDGKGREIRRAVTAYKNFFLRRYSYPLYLVQNFISCPTTFVRRDAFLAAGGFEERFRHSMDYDLFLKLGRQAPPLVIDEPLGVFRMAAGSLSMSGFERQFEEHAQNGREHGAGHPLAVAANRAISRLIVWIYRVLRLVRGTAR